MDIIARRQFAPLYIWLKHYFSGGVSSASSCKKEIYDSVGRASDGRSLYGGGLLTLVVNSLLETNLGMPYIYCIFAAYSSRFTEQLTRREHAISFTERIAENHEEHVKM